MIFFKFTQKNEYFIKMDYDEIDRDSYELGYEAGYSSAESQKFNEKLFENLDKCTSYFVVPGKQNPWFSFDDVFLRFKNLHANQETTKFYSEIEKIGFNKQDMFHIIMSNDMNKISFIDLLTQKNCLYYRDNKILKGHIYHCEGLSFEAQTFFRILVAKCIFFSDFNKKEDYGHVQAMFFFNHKINKDKLENMFLQLSKSVFRSEIFKHFRKSKKSLSLLQDILGNIPNLRDN